MPSNRRPQTLFDPIYKGTLQEIKDAQNQWDLLDAQEKANKLQEQKMQQDKENAERIANATRQAEEDRYNNELELEEIRQQHDDEKRYKKMCDDIGVVYKDIVEFGEWLNSITPSQKKYYADIMNKYYSFLYVDEIKKLDEKLTKDENRLSELEDNLEELEDYDEYDEIKVEGVFKYGSEYEGTIEEIKEDIDNNKNVIRNKKNITIWLTIIAIIVFIIAFLNKTFELAVWTSIITFVIDSYFMIQISNYKKSLYRLENALKKHTNSKNNYSSNIKSLEKTIQKEKQELNRVKEERLKELENNAEFVEMKPKFEETMNVFPLDGKIGNNPTTPNRLKFNEFRCNHYNKDIEALFRNLDMDIDRISTNKIKNNGTIDDYIQYINDALAEEGK